MELTKNIYLQKYLKYFLIIIIGSVLLTISAKFKIPFYPVPMTMQTFVVLLAGMTFGYKIGVSIILVYLLEGILGLPVFSNSPEKGVGLLYFTGPTMGYLIGFIFSAFLAGYLNFNTSYFNVFIKLVFSVSIMYILGVLWLGYLIGWEKPLMKIGVLPFLLAEFFKILLLTLLSKKLLKLKKII